MFGILIGYGLVFFNLFAGNFDVLPDFIGYFLIFRGLDRLCYKSASFNKAKPLALFMSALTLILAVIRLIPAFSNSIILKLAAFAVVMAGLLVSFLIAKGTGELEEVEGKELGSKKLMNFWYVHCVSQILCSVIPTSSSGFFKFVLTASAVAAIAAAIGFIVMLNHARSVYDYVPEPLEESPKKKKRHKRAKRH